MSHLAFDLDCTLSWFNLYACLIYTKQTEMHTEKKHFVSQCDIVISLLVVDVINKRFV